MDLIVTAYGVYDPVTRVLYATDREAIEARQDAEKEKATDK